MYKGWPRSLRTLLQPPSKPNMPIRVARNMVHLVLVVDPVTPEGAMVLEFAALIVDQQMPVRVGVILTSTADLTLELEGQWLEGGAAPGGMAGARDVAELLAQVKAMAIPGAVAWLLRKLGAIQSSSSSGLTIEALETIRSDMQAPPASEGLEVAHSMARGATEKCLPINSFFLNGQHGSVTELQRRLLPLILGEQRMIAQALARGELSLQTKSVYSKIRKMKGLSFHKKYNPIWFQWNSAKHAHALTAEDVSLMALCWLEAEPDIPKGLSFIVVVNPCTAAGISGALAALKFLMKGGDISSMSRVALVWSIPQEASNCPNQKILDAIAECSSMSAVRSALLRLQAGATDEAGALESAKGSCSDRCGGSPPHIAVERLAVLGLVDGEQRVVVNGLFMSDITTWEDYEALGEMLLPVVQSVATALPRAKSDIIMSVSALLATVHHQTRRVDVSKVIADVEAGSPSGKLTLSIDAPGPHLPMLVAVVDPLSLAAQRASTLLRVANQQLGLGISLVLLPALEVKEMPLNNFYRFMLGAQEATIVFDHLPQRNVLTQRLDTPEAWNVQATSAQQDLDNMVCDSNSCGDNGTRTTYATYTLKHMLVAGECLEATQASSLTPPQGLQLLLRSTSHQAGAIVPDTLVMQNFGYFQLKANPGAWKIELAAGDASLIFAMKDEESLVVVRDFYPRKPVVHVTRRPGMELASIGEHQGIKSQAIEEVEHITASHSEGDDQDETIHIFSLASGHLYERFLKVMMLSVVKRTSSPVKFWLLENYLSPAFKASADAMAAALGFDLELATYKWPEWLRQQSEKQRIIWGYKILFLDVLFPADVGKIIYIDADQVVRADVKELWEMDLNGAPYAYTPFCNSREETLGYQFWRGGFWESHLAGKPYHVSALYVVDLMRFRKTFVGDSLRATYDRLSRDPASLSNLDQDLPNFAQHVVPIHSLPVEWLWCESWCSDESKRRAKTIDLCNNPQHKEPKLAMAKRIISGELFQESWTELDEQVRIIEEEAALATAVEGSVVGAGPSSENRGNWEL
ncbi:unnamed protein product [Chrysoparadoxa australica]